MKPRDRSAILVEIGIIAIIQAGFDTYPELDVPEILALCWKTRCARNSPRAIHR